MTKPGGEHRSHDMFVYKWHALSLSESSHFVLIVVSYPVVLYPVWVGSYPNRWSIRASSNKKQNFVCILLAWLKLIKAVNDYVVVPNTCDWMRINVYWGGHGSTSGLGANRFKLGRNRLKRLSTKRLDITKFVLLGSGLAPLVLISLNLCSFRDC